MAKWPQFVHKTLYVKLCILCIVSELVNGGWSDSSGNGCAQDYYYFCLMQDQVTGVEEQPQVAASLQGRPPY